MVGYTLAVRPLDDHHRMLGLDSATLQDVAAIVSPIAAAIAAGVSLASVRLTRRMARDTVLPDLSIQPIVHPETGLLGAMIHNAGTGVARGAYFVIVRGGSRSVDAVGHGVIRPNELFEVQTQIAGRPEDLIGSVDASAAMLVGCRDRQGNFHVWTHKERHREWRRRRLGRDRGGATITDRFQAVFKNFDMDSLTPEPSRIHGPR